MMTSRKTGTYRTGARAGDSASPGGTESAPGHSEEPLSGDDWTSYKDTERAHQIIDVFKQLHISKEHVDVLMLVGGEKFPCHRTALITASPFFRAMFSHTEGHTELPKANLGSDASDNDVSDAGDLPLPSFDLHGIDAGTFGLILDYIYTGECELNEQSVQALLSAANQLQLFRLKAGCAEFMMQRIGVPNCIGLFFFARLYQCPLLAAKAKEMICKHFTSLWQEDEFLNLTFDKLIEVIDDDQLEVAQEEVVYEACLEWMHFDLENRRSSLYEVMCCVRFANISRYYFCDKIETNPLLLEDTRMSELLSKVRYYHILPNRIAEVDLNTCSRDGMSYERGILILANPYSEDQYRKFNSVELLCPRSGSLIKLGKLPHSLYMPGLVVTGENQVFLAGGSFRKLNARGTVTQDGISANLYFSDSSSGTWQMKAKMHRPRFQFALCLVDKYIYAIGGHTGQEITAHVERYDTCTNAWESVASLPRPLRCMAAHSYRGRLFVFGGETSMGDIVNTTYRFDPLENAWTELPSMQTPRALAGCAMIREEMYVVGGNTQPSERWTKELLPEFCTASVEIFDPRRCVWRPGPPLPHALCGAGVVRFGNAIRVVGGEDDKSWMAGEWVLTEAEALATASEEAVASCPLAPTDASGEAAGISIGACNAPTSFEVASNGPGAWKEGQEFSSVMSTFACGVACVNKSYLNHVRNSMSSEAI